MKNQKFTFPKLNLSGKSYYLRRTFDIFIVGLLFMFVMAFTNLESETSVDQNAPFSTQPYLGQLAIFPYNFAPVGWARCDGQLLSISQNTALFSLLGTTYGGDGETTFGLPDLRGRVIVHNGQGPGLPNYQLGSKGGATNSILSVANLPAHNHTASGTILASAATGEENNPTDMVHATHTGGYNEDHNSLMRAGGVNVTVNNTGSGTQFTNMQPYQTIGYYIALQGVFPSQN